MFRNIVGDEILNDTANLVNTLKKKIIAYRALNFTKYTRDVILPDIENVLRDTERQVGHFFAAQDFKAALQSVSMITRALQSPRWIIVESRATQSHSEENQSGLVQYRNAQQRNRGYFPKGKCFGQAKIRDRQTHQQLRTAD
jgi:hypothetical protein